MVVVVDDDVGGGGAPDDADDDDDGISRINACSSSSGSKEGNLNCLPNVLQK